MRTVGLTFKKKETVKNEKTDEKKKSVKNEKTDEISKLGDENAEIQK